MGNSVGVEPLKLHLETNSQLQIYSLWRSVCMLFFNRATKISMVISSTSRSKNFVLDAFLNAKFSVLSVALSAAPDINTSPSTALHQLMAATGMSLLTLCGIYGLP